MMFGMVERGLEDQNFGDKGKAKELASDGKGTGHGEDAMWAVILTKELWRKGIWYVHIRLVTSMELTEELGTTQNR